MVCTMAMLLISYIIEVVYRLAKIFLVELIAETLIEL